MGRLDASRVTWSTTVRSPFFAKAGMALEIVVALSEYEIASSVPMNDAISSSICESDADDPEEAQRAAAVQGRRRTTGEPH